MTTTTAYINGKIYCMDEKNHIVEAILIENNKIKAIGANQSILNLTTSETKIIDLEGKLMLPGFNDSHMHVMEYGFLQNRVQLSNVRSISELIEKMKEGIPTMSSSWLIGNGWNQDYFEVPLLPTKHDLDLISTQIPIAICRACLHIAVVNSKALSLMFPEGILPTIDGGTIEVDDDGFPTGIICENALNYLYKLFPSPTPTLAKKLLTEKVFPELASYGITSIQSDDFTFLNSYKDVISVFKELSQEKLMTVRINEQCNLPTREELHGFMKEGHVGKIYSPYFKSGPLKIIGDGSLGARTAFLSYPYRDDATTYGILIYSPEELDYRIKLAHKEGMSVAIHAIGDQTIKYILTSLKDILSYDEGNKLRHGIVHSQITDPSILKDFSDYNIIAYIQPIFLHYDLHIVESRVGKELASTSYAFKTMVTNHIPICSGSDCPVEHFNVLNNIYCAVTRKDLTGNPPNGFLPEQALSVYEAVKSFTTDGAYASFEEHIKGQILPGMLADLVILEEDIFQIPLDRIKDVSVFSTIFDGKEIYNKNV